MERPIGSNSGSFIDSWNKSFNLYKVPWCATSASNFVKHNDAKPYVWSPIALDFAKTKHKFSIKDIQLGAYTPKSGDYLVWSYGGGKGHIDFIINYDNDVINVIGGNRNNGVNAASYSISELRAKKAKWIVPVKGNYTYYQKGIGSYYHNSLHGNLTANGQVYDTTKVSAAHKSLPFGTKVKVTNLDNHESIEVVINDRGPFVEGRIIDLSKAAADSIDLSLNKVSIEVLK